MSSKPPDSSAPDSPDRDDPATTFIARELQSSEPPAKLWATMAEKVEAFLRRTNGRRRLPLGCEFDDFRQLVFCALINGLPRLEIRGRDSFWGFVRKVADHIEIDLGRRARAQRRGSGVEPAQQMSGDGADLLDNTTDEEAWTASVVARVHEIQDREMDCVGKALREEEQQVYLLRRRDGARFGDIARAVGRNNEVTVRVIFKRAREKVLACLKGELDGYSSMFAAAE